MREPQFKVGETVEIGVDPSGWVAKTIQGKWVKIVRVYPYDEVHEAIYYDVQVLNSDLTEKVHEDWIETRIL